MLTCDLFVRANNGEVSLLYPDMERLIGTERALQQHFIITEFEQEFNAWYNKQGTTQSQTGGQLDENGEPMLIDGAYFENSSGERWFIDEVAKFDKEGNLTKRQYRIPKSRLIQAFETGLSNAQNSLKPLTENQFKLAEMMSTPFSFYKESYRPNITVDTSENSRILSDLVVEIFLPNQQQKFMDIIEGRAEDTELDSFNMLHPETKKQITYLQYYHFEFDRFKKEQDFLHDTMLRMKLSPFLSESEFIAQKDSLFEEYLRLPFETHVNEQEFFDFWTDEIKLDKDRLNRLWKRMSQKTGSFHKIIRQNFGALYREVSNEVTDRMLERHVERNYGPGKKIADQMPEQKDIWEASKYFLSVVDFSEEQMGMQRLGILTSEATGVAENEMQRAKNELNKKMTEVAKHYWAHEPGSSKMEWLFHPVNTVKLLFNRVDRHNKPYLWMFEKEYVLVDPNDPLAGYTEGEYTGRMIERFNRTEEDVRQMVYERDANEEYKRELKDLFDMALKGDHDRMKRFMTVTEYDTLTRMVEDYENLTEALKKGVYLNTTQRAKLQRIETLLSQGSALSAQDQDFYDDVYNRIGSEPPLTKKQERYLDFIHVKGRHLVARAMAVQKDSDFFRDLQESADRGSKESKAKLELYDYLYKMNLQLSEDNDNLFGQPLDRGFMPQVSMNTYEAYNRTKSFMDAYIQFGTSLDNTDLYGEYEVTQELNGKPETKTFNEWLAYYKDPARSKSEKLKAPYKLQRMKAELESKWINGKSADPVNRKQFAASFSVSNTIPFRTVAKKQDFSVNASRIFLAHFESLIFRKHHNKLVPLYQAVQTHYDEKSRQSGKTESFKNIKTYVDDYADRYFFGRRRGDFNNSFIGKTIDKMLTATTLAFLSASPKTSAMNLAVGMNESLRQKVSMHGWASGFEKFAIGLKRMGQPNILKGIAKGEGFDMISRKSKAFIEHFNLETFTNIDIENQQDFMFGIGDHMMVLQKKTEVLIRGTSIMGEMTEEQWNSFTVNDRGFLEVTDRNNFPKSAKVKEWNYYISSVQGNYTPEGRMNYHNFVIFKSAMLFKTWMSNFISERLRPTFTDGYGVKRQGYYLTLPQVIFEYKKVISHYRNTAGPDGKLEEYQIQNLRKIAYDLSMFTMILTSMSFFDDNEDDPALAFIKDLLLTYQTQLYFLFDLKEILGIISRPFPWMGMLESWVGALDYFWEGKFEKSFDLAKSTVPGNRVVDFGEDMFTIYQDE